MGVKIPIRGVYRGGRYRSIMSSDWQEGKELKNGRPDPDYVGRYIALWVTDQNWVCRIQWGSTWGHLVFANAESAVEALESAAAKAAFDGCPLNWLPGYEIPADC